MSIFISVLRVIIFKYVSAYKTLLLKILQQLPASE